MLPVVDASSCEFQGGRNNGDRAIAGRPGVFLISVEIEPEMKAMQDTNPQRPKAIGLAKGLGLMVDLLGQASSIYRGNPWSPY